MEQEKPKVYTTEDFAAWGKVGGRIGGRKGGIIGMASRWKGHKKKKAKKKKGKVGRPRKKAL